MHDDRKRGGQLQEQSAELNLGFAETQSEHGLSSHASNQVGLEARRCSLMGISPTTIMLRHAVVHRHVLRQTQLAHPFKRAYSTPPPPQPPSRVARLESRLPRFLQRFIVPLRHAPISHITAFLVLHEITAIVPLFALAGAFHYFTWLPPYISEWKWAHEGMKKYGNYMRRKGWISDDTKKGRWWGRSEGGVKIVVEIATAYAITKALLPLRLILSVWASPWFARWAVLPITGRISRMFSRTKGATSSTAKPVAAAGTGAVGGGALPKEAKPP